MKKTIATLALILAAGTAQAEVAYNYKKSSHVADKECIAVYSVARDALFKIVEPTAEVVKVRNTITELQNNLILKYAYSKQLNKHVDIYKFLVNQRINEQGPAYLTTAVQNCN